MLSPLSSYSGVVKSRTLSKHPRPAKRARGENYPVLIHQGKQETAPSQVLRDASENPVRPPPIAVPTSQPHKSGSPPQTARESYLSKKGGNPIAHGPHFCFPKHMGKGLPSLFPKRSVPAATRPAASHLERNLFRFAMCSTKSPTLACQNGATLRWPWHNADTLQEAPDARLHERPQRDHFSDSCAEY